MQNLKTTKQIEVVQYDSNWPHIYEKESSLIMCALGDNCIEIHHIGSTSVIGLAAKPKIDIISAVQNPLLAIEQLKEIGIQYRGEYNIPSHYGFSKRGEINLNLHVYEEGHPEIELNLMFRDYLRNSAKRRDDYARLKEELLNDDASFDKVNSLFTKYTLRKGDFIRNILKEAGFDKIRIMKCNDDFEWSAAKNFRSNYFSKIYGIDDPYTWTFNNEDHAHLVLYKGVDIVGCAHVQFLPDKNASLNFMSIDSNNRNKNYESVFLSFIEKWMKAIGIKTFSFKNMTTFF